MFADAPLSALPYNFPSGLLVSGCFHTSRNDTDSKLILARNRYRYRNVSSSYTPLGCWRQDGGAIRITYNMDNVQRKKLHILISHTCAVIINDSDIGDNDSVIIILFIS